MRNRSKEAPHVYQKSRSAFCVKISVIYMPLVLRTPRCFLHEYRSQHMRRCCLPPHISILSIIQWRLLVRAVCGDGSQLEKDKMNPYV